jgi:hypothetical protein
MRYLGAQSNAKDLVAQEQLSALISNPMTSIRDLIVGGVGGAPTRLPGPTSEGLVLTCIGNALAWAIATGFANPMTAGGDLIIGGTNGAATRLAGGTAGQVLTMVAGAPAWVTPSGGGGGGGDFKADGSVQMTGALNEAPPVELGPTSSYRLPLALPAAKSNTIKVIAGAVSFFNSMDFLPLGSRRQLVFTVPMTMVNTSGLILLTGDSIDAVPGDTAQFLMLSESVWKMERFDKFDGTALKSSAVTSVAGRTGAVTLAKSDVGLANADNTADSAKPVSMAQQAALDLKANLSGATFGGSVGATGSMMVSAAGASSFPSNSLYRARGTIDAPTGVFQNDKIGEFAFQAVGSDGVVTTALSMEGFTTEAHGPSGRGIQVNFATVRTGQTGRSVAFNIGGDGRLTASGGIATPAGISTILGGPMRLGPYTLTTLPSAAAWPNYLIIVTNATGGSKVCWSNGTNWCLLNTTTIVS